MKKGILAIALIAATGAAASAQTISLGAPTSVYVGFTRGFSYIAPMDHTIVGLELPQEAFITGATASYIVDVNPNVLKPSPEVYEIGKAGAIVVNVKVLAGDLVMIIGNWTEGTPTNFSARNSYSSGASNPQLLLGNAVTLARSGFQWDIADNTYTSGAGFSGLAGSYGRIIVSVVPAPASLALLGLGGLVAVRRRR